MSGRLDEIRARLDAATPGPWYWRNTQEVYLFGARSKVVMAFRRMGMSSAQPQFRRDDGLLYDAGKENIHAFSDASLIANAPGDLRYLLGAVERALALVDEIERDGIMPEAAAPLLRAALDGA